MQRLAHWPLAPGGGLCPDNQAHTEPGRGPQASETLPRQGEKRSPLSPAVSGKTAVAGSRAGVLLRLVLSKRPFSLVPTEVGENVQ